MPPASDTEAAPSSLRLLAQRLAADAEAGRREQGSPLKLPVARYLDPERLAREQAQMRLGPLILAQSSEIPRGGCLALDRLGLPLLLARDAEGQLHGHYNVCRHRGMRLVETGGECRNLVCPYHGWTYALDGRLTGLPHRESFDALPESLRAFPVAERHGLVWGWPAAQGREPPQDLGAWLGAIGPELDWFGLPQAVVFRRAEIERHCNWKLIVEAFLEGYHIRVLHRDTIYPFFLDATAVSETQPPHIRSAAARRRITVRGGAPVDLRLDCTFTHYLFPNTVLIFHPDYTSVITLWPLAPDRVLWSHAMLVPESQRTEQAFPHWDKSFRLIEEGVFQSEDLRACEGIQAGLASGANECLTAGRLEYALAGFHHEWDRRLAEVHA
jgi:phenylpropionate dioxygenase-like ring-hydroxylating dioxygenase large terminal subunit